MPAKIQIISKIYSFIRKLFVYLRSEIQLTGSFTLFKTDSRWHRMQMKRFSQLSQIIYIGCFLLIGSLMGILFYEVQLTYMPFKDCIMISSIGSLLTIVLQLIINSLFFSERAPLPTSILCIAVIFLYFFSICILTIIYTIYLEGIEGSIYAFLFFFPWTPLSFVLFPVLYFITKFLEKNHMGTE